MNTITINGAFRGQQLTGQQRYAAELAAALLILEETIRERRAPHRIQKNKWLAWLWAQFLVFENLRSGYLLTLTSRGPLLARRHVITVHDLFVLSHPEWFSRFYCLSHVVALKWQIRSAALIIAVSEPVAAQLRALPLCKTRVVVAPNAPAHAFLRSGQDSGAERLLGEFGLQQGGFLLALSSTDPRKNMSMLFESYEGVPQGLRSGLPLVVVGPGPSSVFAACSADAPPSEIRHLGYVTDGQLAGLYGGAAAVLFPTLDEGFGLPAVEALACGATLVVSDIEVLRWVCGEHATYVDPTSVAAWTEVITSIAAGHGAPEDVESRSARRASVEARFSWNTSAQTVLRAITAFHSDRESN